MQDSQGKHIYLDRLKLSDNLDPYKTARSEWVKTLTYGRRGGGILEPVASRTLNIRVCIRFSGFKGYSRLPNSAFSANRNNRFQNLF